MKLFFILAVLSSFALSGATLKHTSVGIVKHNVATSGKSSVVMLGTLECPFCVSTEEAIKELSYTLDKKVNFFSIDIEQFPDAAQEFSVKATPTVLFYSKEGVLKGRYAGGMSKKGLEKKLAEIGVVP